MTGHFGIAYFDGVHQPDVQGKMGWTKAMADFAFDFKDNAGPAMEAAR